MAATATPTGTSSSAAASSTGCGAILYDIPTKDAACAMPYGGNHTDILTKCCNAADVVSYADNCGLYCLAQGQTVDDLTACLFQNGAPWADVFCSDTGNATATVTGNDAPLSSGASVIAAGSKSASATSSGAGATGSSDSSKSAASARVGLGGFVSVPGLTVTALLFSSVVFRAL